MDVSPRRAAIASSVRAAALGCVRACSTAAACKAAPSGTRRVPVEATGSASFALYRRTTAPTGMPDRDYFQPRAAYAVVDPIASAIDVKAPDAGRACFCDYSAHVGLFDEEGECSLEVFANRSRRSRAVDCPPPRDAVDLSCRAP